MKLNGPMIIRLSDIQSFALSINTLANQTQVGGVSTEDQIDNIDLMRQDANNILTALEHFEKEIGK